VGAGARVDGGGRRAGKVGGAGRRGVFFFSCLDSRLVRVLQTGSVPGCSILFLFRVA
jgi:hypothetical protein